MTIVSLNLRREGPFQDLHGIKKDEQEEASQLKTCHEVDQTVGKTTNYLFQRFYHLRFSCAL